MQERNKFLRKLGSLQKALRKISKLRWEIRLEIQIRNLRKQDKMIKQKKTKKNKNAETCRNKQKKAIQEKITIQLEEIYRKYWQKKK